MTGFRLSLSLADTTRLYEGSLETVDRGAHRFRSYYRRHAHPYRPSDPPPPLIPHYLNYILFDLVPARSNPHHYDENARGSRRRRDKFEFTCPGLLARARIRFCRNFTSLR